MYDIATYGDLLISAGSFVLNTDPRTAGGGLSISKDCGNTWSIDYHFGPLLASPDAVYNYNSDDPGVWRFTNLFKFNGTLYASGWGMSRLYKFNGNTFSFANVDLFPNTPSMFEETPTSIEEPESEDAEHVLLADPRIGGYITNAVEFKNILVYIGGVVAIDHDWIPVGIYKATEIEERAIKRLRFLEEEDEPRDLMVFANTLYVLASREAEDGFVTSVYSTMNTNDWQRVLRFTADAPAYSFEYLDGYMYFGLGGDRNSSGEIHRCSLGCDAGS